MKLTDITLNEGRMFGDYGSAVMQNLSNKLAASGEGSMSTLDKMTKDQYINNFVGLASTNLQSAIDSTRVDPNATSQPAAQQPASTGTGAPAQATPSSPQSPEEIRKAKLAAGAKAAQANMAANPVPSKPAAPVQQTPAQIRQQKQAAAAKTAQANMAPVSKLPANQPAVQAQNIRQQKQGAAKTAAQANMAKNPVPAKPLTPAQIRQQKQAAASRNLFKESVIMEAGMSISDFIQQFVKKQLQGLDIGSEQAKIKELADKVQATYNKDGGKAAITHIANLAFSLEHAGGAPATATTPTTADIITTTSISS